MLVTAMKIWDRVTLLSFHANILSASPKIFKGTDERDCYIVSKWQLDLGMNVGTFTKRQEGCLEYHHDSILT